jgi:drug/metabolite transporter (DMT)-like permease
MNRPGSAGRLPNGAGAPFYVQLMRFFATEPAVAACFAAGFDRRLGVKTDSPGAMKDASQRPARPAAVSGALYMTGAALMMALLGTSVKWATEGLPAPVVVFFRNLFGLIALLPVLARPGGVDLQTRKLRYHLLRCLFGVSAMYCYFYALSQIKLAEAVMLNFTSPLFIPLIAWLWLREALTRRMMLAALVGFAGVALIKRPGFETVSTGAMVALLSAVFASAALVSVRKLSATEPVTRIVFYFTVGTTVLTALPLPWCWSMPAARQWLPLMTTGVCATIAQFLLSKGYSLAPAGVAATFQYITVPAAALLGWLVWGERLDWFAAGGGVLVVAAGIVASLPARLRGAPAAAIGRTPPDAA